MDVHIHQGGTVRTYCRRPLAINSRTVAWEDASRATCPRCTALFAKYHDLEVNAEAAGAWIAANIFSRTQSFDDRYNEDREAGGAPVVHTPGQWYIVNQSPLVLSAMCTCGNDECAFTTNPATAVNTMLNRTGYVPI